MDEFELINAIQQKTYKQSSLMKGVGDDAAVFRPTGYDVVTAVDTFVENVHFSSKTTTPFHIGYRALAVNLSDIAAMGAEPKFYLVSIVVPESVTDADLIAIFTGMKELAQKYKIDLIGGDTVSGTQLTISITIIGYVEKNKARYRHTAEAGDVVFVTGTLGDAAAGLHFLLNGLDRENAPYFIKRHQMPTPRIDFTRALRDFKRITLNDVSDGIASELNEIATASNVTITIDDEKIPLHESLNQFPENIQTEWKYFAGEDFEIVGTAPAGVFPKIKQIAKEQNVQLTKIGIVSYNEQRLGQVYMQKNNRLTRLEKRGYTHLK